MKQKGVKKGSLALYVLLLVVSIAVMIVLKNFDKIYGSDDAKDNKEVIVAIEYSPLSFYTYDDTLGGYSYDLLRLIAKHGGMALNFQPMVTLASSLDKLKKGEYRIVCAEFPVMKENKDEYLFTNPVYIDRQVLVQRMPDDSTQLVKSLLDLAHDTVWVVEGSSIYTRMMNLSHEIGDTIYVQTDKEYGSEQLFLRVVAGEIKQAVMNERIAKKLAQLYPQVNVDTKVSFSQFQSWVLHREDSVFCDSVNAWLEAVKLTPEYEELNKRYFEE